MFVNQIPKCLFANFKKRPQIALKEAKFIDGPFKIG